MSVDSYVMAGELLCIAACGLTLMVIGMLVMKMKARTVIAGANESDHVRNGVSVKQYIMTRQVKYFLHVSAALLGFLAVCAV
jgi:hypothetical protein